MATAMGTHRRPASDSGIRATQTTAAPAKKQRSAIDHAIACTMSEVTNAMAKAPGMVRTHASDHVAGDAPAHRGEPAAGADTDDGAGDRVRRRDRDPGARREEQRRRRGRLRGHAAHRLEAGDLRAHRLHDAPSAAAACPGRWRCGPTRTTHSGTSAIGAHLTGRDQQHEDDAHRLLRVVGAVAEAERGGRHELAPPEVPVEPVDPLATGGTIHMIDERDDEPEGQADQRREDDEDADLAQALGLEHVKPGSRHRGAGHAADERVRRARRAGPGRT